LRENLCRQLAVTYHKLRGGTALFVDSAYVEPVDPLFLTAGFHLFDLDTDRAQRLDSVQVMVRDPNNNALRGTITLRYAWLPPSFGSIDKSRDAAGLNTNARFSVLKDYHGLIFSRNGRLIDVQTRTPWTAFINNDRYSKVEIEFPATIDELFGVTTSKQQVTVSPLMWDLLRQAGLPKAIEQLRAKVREAKLTQRTKSLFTAPSYRASERAMSAAASPRLPTGFTGFEARRLILRSERSPKRHAGGPASCLPKEMTRRHIACCPKRPRLSGGELTRGTHHATIPRR
jgi:hypothetical protein